VVRGKEQVIQRDQDCPQPFACSSFPEMISWGVEKETSSLLSFSIKKKKLVPYSLFLQKGLLHKSLPPPQKKNPKTTAIDHMQKESARAVDRGRLTWSLHTLSIY